MKNVTTFTIVLMSVLVLASTFSYAQNFWQQKSSLNSAVNELAITSAGNLIAATHGKGLQLSTDDGSTWTRIDNPASMTGYYYSVYVDKNDRIFLGSYLGQAYRSADNGATWTKFYFGDSTALVTSFAMTKSGKLFAGTCGSGLSRTKNKNGLYFSTDNGEKWDTLVAPDFPTPVMSSFVTSIKIDSRQNIFVGTYGGGIYKSKDDGVTWTRDGAENWRVNTLADGANGRLFVGTDNGIFYDSLQVDSVKNTNGAFIKLDTSRSGWEESGWHMDSIFTNYFYPKIYDTTATDPLTIDSSKTDTVITYDTLWLHNQWYAMSLAATAGGHIYGATYGHGLYLSTDNGVSWKVTNGIADSAVTSVLLNPTTGYLYASTTTGAFFKSANPDLTNSPPEVTQTTLKPLSAILEQNYPNPFNPTTNIPFILHEAGYTSLVIYDMLGKEVARLVDGVVTAGRHEARWDASSVSTGVYFYRLQTASTIKTGKLTLIK